MQCGPGPSDVPSAVVLSLIGAARRGAAQRGACRRGCRWTWTHAETNKSHNHQLADHLVPDGRVRLVVVKFLVAAVHKRLLQAEPGSVKETSALYHILGAQNVWPLVDNITRRRRLQYIMVGVLATRGLTMVCIHAWHARK